MAVRHFFTVGRHHLRFTGFALLPGFDFRLGLLLVGRFLHGSVSHCLGRLFLRSLLFLFLCHSFIVWSYFFLRFRFLHQLRVFNRITDGDPLPRTDQFGQIRVQGMMGKPGQLDRLFLAGNDFLRNLHGKQYGSLDGILPVQLIEVPVAEKQHRVRVLLLQCVKLSEKGGILVCILFLGHGKLVLDFETLGFFRGGMELQRPLL